MLKATAAKLQFTSKSGVSGATNIDRCGCPAEKFDQINILKICVYLCYENTDTQYTGQFGF